MKDIHAVVAALRTLRRIEGISALLLPYTEAGKPDFNGLESLLELSWNAGLQPAVNMDTGYVHLLSSREREEVLSVAQRASNGRSFVAGAFIETEMQPTRNTSQIVGLYRTVAEQILAAGGTPILFQCSSLQELEPGEIIRVYAEAARGFPGVLAFELGKMFAPFGQIFPLDVVRDLIRIPEIKGMKHSSLDRAMEWQRLQLRDSLRPEFRLYTGNDLAIDMVMYGSDYLLGLSSFAPLEFARRDRMWEIGEVGFYALNDLLQYLGCFAFRAPVPAYKHSAAQFLHLRGYIASDATHPRSPQRPPSDKAILLEVLRSLEESA